MTSIEVNKYIHIYCTNVYTGSGNESSMLSVKYIYKIPYSCFSMKHSDTTWYTPIWKKAVYFPQV